MPILKTALFSLLIIFCSVACRSQSVQHQTIVYNLHLQGSLTDGLTDYMRITVHAKKGKVLVEWTSMTFSMKELITDTGGIRLLNSYTGKMISREPPLAAKDSNWYKHAITYFNDTKKVAGYDCKKALVTERNGDTTTVWYTEQLPPAPFGAQAQFFSLMKGMPLEFDINNKKGKITITAGQVSTATIADSVFIIDTTGYKDIGAEMLKNMP